MNDETPAYPVNSLQLYRLIDYLALAAYDAAQSPAETGEMPIEKSANSIAKSAGKADAKRRTADFGYAQDSESIVR
jgi:hypothetical protein